jgi:hypothetical protein
LSILQRDGDGCETSKNPRIMETQTGADNEDDVVMNRLPQKTVCVSKIIQLCDIISHCLILVWTFFGNDMYEGELHLVMICTKERVEKTNISWE